LGPFPISGIALWYAAFDNQPRLENAARENQERTP
jgi:hypothetical protein